MATRVRRDILNAATRELLAEGWNVSVLRGDGGYSNSKGESDPAPPALPAVPQYPSDTHVELPTHQQSALLYRLTGDRNPLHADPTVAAKAGFPRPILHGLCTYGMA